MLNECGFCVEMLNSQRRCIDAFDSQKTTVETSTYALGMSEVQIPALVDLFSISRLDIQNTLSPNGNVSNSYIFTLMRDLIPALKFE